MKKILMLTNEFPPVTGGIGTYTVQLATAATVIGHDVTVVAPEPKAGFPGNFSNNYPFRVVRFRLHTFPPIKRLSQLLRTWCWVTADNFDIIHAVDWPHLLAMGLLNKFKSTPFVATVYGTEILWVLESRKLKHLFVKNVFEIPERIFAISEYVKSHLLSSRPEILPEDVSVTYLGVDPRLLDSSEQTKNIREIYSIPDDHKIILTLSRLDERKGHRVILRSLAKFPPELKRRVTHLIVGGGGDRTYISELHRLAGRTGVNVIFTGPMPDELLPSLYASPTLFCLPGELHPRKTEGFGLVYLEAAAKGLPSVACRIGGVPEVVLHQETGLLVEPEDEGGLTQALIRLLEDEQYCEKLGRAAYEYSKNFTWRRCAEQTYGL